jgi:hypothetical protein
VPDQKFQRPRLASGEYYSEAHSNEVKEEARHIFLDAIRRKTPEVLEELQNHVLPAYKALYEVAQQKDVPVGPWKAKRRTVVIPEEAKHLRSLAGESNQCEFTRGWTGKGHRFLTDNWRRTNESAWPADIWPYVVSLRRALIQWMCQFHLRRRWILDAVLDTMARVVTQGVGRGLKWARPTTWLNYQRTEEFQFSHDGWSPFKTARDEYTQAVRKALEAKLRTYLDDLETKVSQFSKTVPEVRNPEHFEWLALYVVCRMSPAQIRELYRHVEISAIEKGIKSAAGLSRFYISPKPTGRKKKIRK